MTALTCGYLVRDAKPSRLCGEAIEPGQRLPWRHVNGTVPNVRPHYAFPAPRPTADDLAALGNASSRDARLSPEALDRASVSDPSAGLPPPADGVRTPEVALA